MSYLTNALVYLFKSFEEVTSTEFPNFMVNEVPDQIKSQPYMQAYANKNVVIDNGQLYKFLYDPELQFGFRFHQRISKIRYDDRKEPWISIIFSTGEVKPLTGVLSHVYEQIKILKKDGEFFDVKVRRVLTPVNFVFISNNMDYLYRYLQKLSFYFDRIIEYPYQQKIYYDETHFNTYCLQGMAKSIVQKDLTKLDTERRGGLATAGYGFDLIYYDMDTPLKGYLLENIDLNIKYIENSGYLNLKHMP